MVLMFGTQSVTFWYSTSFPQSRTIVRPPNPYLPLSLTLKERQGGTRGALVDRLVFQRGMGATQPAGGVCLPVGMVSRSSWLLLSVFFVISRFSWSVVLIMVVSRRGQLMWLVVLHGQSVVLVVLVSRGGQSFFLVSLFDCRGQSWWSLVLRVQSFFMISRSSSTVVLIVVVSRRGQSFFVDGVYILWWLCTRIY